jgi:hypothetical protein
MASPNVDGEALLQDMWDAMHAAGPPRPPWEVAPTLFA